MSHSYIIFTVTDYIFAIVASHLGEKSDSQVSSFTRIKRAMKLHTRISLTSGFQLKIGSAHVPTEFQQYHKEEILRESRSDYYTLINITNTRR